MPQYPILPRLLMKELGVKGGKAHWVDLLTWLPTLILLLPANTCSAQCDSLALAHADTLFAHKKFKAASKAYQSMVDRGSCVAYAYSGLAGCAQRQGAPNTEVIGFMNKAVELEPADHILLRSRSNVYMSVGMFERSYEDLEKALKTVQGDSLRAEYISDQAMDLMNTRRNKEAKTLLLEAFALSNTSGTVINNLGVVADELGETEEAYSWIAKFIALDTTETTGYLNMGFLLARNSRYSEALTYYARAEKMGTKDAYFFNNRGYAKLMSGDTKGALVDIDRSLKILSSNSYAYRNQGLVYQAMGRQDDACKAFEAALALGYTKRYGDDVKKAYDDHCH
ncbi:MAG: tetratricopeptide repeat protein [Flavobacteriales bacterium]